MTKEQRRNWNTEIVAGLSAMYDFNFLPFTVYHLRINIHGKKLDYYPQSGKACWTGTNSWFVIPDIEKFLDDRFKTKRLK